MDEESRCRDLEYLAHELQVHQVELEARNHELIEMQHALEVARDRYADLYDFAPVGYLTLGISGNVLEINLTGASMLGAERSQIVGMPFSIWVSRESTQDFFKHIQAVFSSKKSRATVELEIKCRGGMREASLESMVVEREGNVCRTVMVDITEKRKQERIHYLAQYDVLTGLPNRILFQDRLSHALAAAGRDGTGGALLFLDIDRFKSVNDSLGHAAGDQLLKDIADRVKGCIRKADTVARLAGDEFVLVLPDIDGEAHVCVVAENILEVMRAPFSIEGHSISVSVSIGVSLYPNDGRDFNALIRSADSAMYHAKKIGRNNFQFYSEEMNAKALESLSMENDLRLALKNGDLVVHYQPQVEIGSGKIVGMEALIRWHRPGDGWVSPAAFIPIAEERGLIVPIFDMVLREVCLQIQIWQSMGLPSIPVAINISALQIRRHGLLGSIAHALRTTGISPTCLELELTESTIMHEVEATILMMRELKAMGLKLTIDDFGIGYSSLSYLRSFPIHKLKIAHSFVADLTTNSDAAAIASAIINMAKSLKLKVIAEGVETEEQLGYLRAQGCDEVQGYYFSEAIAAEKFTELLKCEQLLVGKNLG
ncbi:MAG: EAL domain-containing protein [Burkholderiales bacterium]|nr:EAL domain-containing protein [Burkholderiales bacterium]